MFNETKFLQNTTNGFGTRFPTPVQLAIFFKFTIFGTLNKLNYIKILFRLDNKRNLGPVLKNELIPGATFN